MPNSTTLLVAFSLALLAGMSTMLGAAFAFAPGSRSPRSFAVALGFSAGVMVFISFMELLPEGIAHLTEFYGESGGEWRAILGFFVGIAVVALLDVLIPHIPHREGRPETMRSCQRSPLYRIGIIAVVAIALHNLPEGLITLVGVADDIHIGFILAVAIAIHNIPEGISVAAPVYAATGSRRTALWYTFVAGIAEPVGAFLGYLLLRSCLVGVLCGFAFTAVAGIMVYLSLDQMLPTARAHTDPHWAMMGFVSGMLCMAVSILLLGLG
ncbi:MAG: zinc transporter ZupT [Candidatus Peribacteraceae bacterium]|nr:zinc transporter ZupT [Candidatus Peribacteraceae bacterium]